MSPILVHAQGGSTRPPKPASVKVSAWNARRGQPGGVDSRANSVVSTLLADLCQQSPAAMPPLASIAGFLNISPGYLRHVIKQETGVSFSRYVKRLRLGRARQLLQETNWNVKQVMVHVGISDHSHFAKDYKKEFGESPTQTRWNAATVLTKIAPWRSETGVGRACPQGSQQKCFK